jgi:type IV secretion system protein VirD4
MLDGQQGVALAAPPRSGKGVGFVIPNLLNWPGSVVCVDIKRENWTVTAGFRASAGQRCFLFDPLSETGATDCWNAFTYVSEAPALRVNDLQRIASMFYPDAPGTDPFWMASARSVFLGIALYVFETRELPKTIGEVLRQGMASDDEGFAAHWKRIIQGRQRGKFPLSDACVRSLSDVIDLAPVTASSIRKTFTSRLDLFLNPLIDAATAHSSFDLRELRRTPISIYVAVNPDDLHRLRPLLSLFFEQAIGLQTRVLPEHDASLKHAVLMLLDECPALGPIPILAESIAYVPGYNVRIAMVFQAPSQLRQAYGVDNAKTMLKSLGARVVFAPKDYEDAKEISDELGVTTVTSRTRSYPQSLFGAQGKAFGKGNLSISMTGRALRLPQELKEMRPNECLIFCEGVRPILARKIRYFRNRSFKARLTPAPTVKSRIALSALTTTSEERLGPLAMTQASGIDRTPEPLGSSETIEPPDQERPATAADIERLESLSLDELALDLSGVKLPPGESISPQELEQAVEAFMQAIPRA